MTDRTKNGKRLWRSAALIGTPGPKFTSYAEVCLFSVTGFPMTSFIIQAHEGRPLPESWKPDPDCPFCRIIKGDLPAFRVYEDDKVIAVLG